MAISLKPFPHKPSSVYFYVKGESSPVRGKSFSEDDVKLWLEKNPRTKRITVRVHYFGSSWSVDFTFTGSSYWDSDDIPVQAIASLERKFTMLRFWLYKKKLYQTNDHELTAADVLALINNDSNKRRLQLDKAHALQAMAEQLTRGTKREIITSDIKMFVWQRDAGSCVECSSNQNLEFDHVIPLAMGGSNSARNLQLLCETCNRRKGASLG
jgi:hypothetical protein